VEQYRGTLLLLAVLLALGGFVYFNEQRSGATNGNHGNQGALVFSFEQEDIRSLGIKDGDKTVDLVKDGSGIWRIANQGDIEADEWKVASVLWRVAQLHADRTVADRVEAPADYGLNEPSMAVTIGPTGGQAETLHIGNQNSRQTGYYAVKASGGPLYLINASLIHDLRRLTSEPPAKPAPTTGPEATTEVIPEATPAP
jgi:hypothetical protein